MNTGLKSEHQNPLVKTRLTDIDTWSRWLKAWEATELTQTRMGLLDYGFGCTVEDTQRQQRLCFYLDHADCHLVTAFLGRKADVDNPSIIASRARVARKAFEVVVDYLPHVEDQFWNGSFPYSLFAENLLEKMVWFMRGAPNGSVSLNIPDIHDRTHDRKFNVWAQAFAKALSSWLYNDEFRDKSTAEQWQRVVDLRPALLSVIRELKLFDIFTKNGHHVDNHTIYRMVEMAADSPVPIPPSDLIEDDRMILWTTVRPVWIEIERKAAVGDPMATCLERLWLIDKFAAHDRANALGQS